MVISSLVVSLEANIASYVDNMEKAAHHTEMIGRRITRAGTEITKVFAPLAALYAGALTAAVKQSEIVHGHLAQTWDHLVLSGRLLLREIGTALTPAFEQMIASKERLIQKARQLVEWFEHLSPATQSLIVKVGLFLAVLGPTVLIIGSVVRAAGALWLILSQLAGLIAAVVVPVLAFLVSPVGLVILAIIALVGVLALLIRHWELVKEAANVVWQGIKLLIIDAVDKVLAALDQLFRTLPGWGWMVEKIDAAHVALGNLRLQTELSAQAAEKLIGAYHKPLLPEWLTSLPAKIKALFTLPAVGTLPSLPFLQAQDALAKLATSLKEASAQSALFGNSFNLAAAQASAYKTTIDELLKQGVGLDQVLNGNGLTLRDLGATYRELAREATLYGAITNAINKAITDSFVALGEQLGHILAGISHGFHGFLGVLKGILGQMFEAIGQALIAYGVALMPFVEGGVLNPFTAIAAGMAVTALGAALASSAQAAISAGGGGGAAAPAVGSAGASTTPSSQGSGTVYLELHGDTVVGAMFADPRNQDALAQAMRDLSGRNVQVVPVAG